MAENQQLFCRYSTAFNRTNSGIETAQTEKTKVETEKLLIEPIVELKLH